VKKYHVYGIGNALVDMEMEVTPDFLKEMNVEKGFMTLVDQGRQDELLSKVEGNMHKRTCGGSAANTIIGFTQLGGKSFYSCKVANDETGDFYFKDLVSQGVSTNLTDKRIDGITGKCMVFVTPDADRTMNTYLGITETFSETELVEEEIKLAEYLYIEGYLVTSETGRAAALKAKNIAESNGVKTALTFSDPAMATYFKDGLKEMIGEKVDLLFCNEEEAMVFTDSKTIEEACEKIKTFANTFAITMGAKGSCVFDGTNMITVSTEEVKPVDTNGAGDLFAGSFLYGITHGLDFEKSAQLACKAASKLVTKFGARLDKAELTSIKAEVL
jgi:sugar/nucleoside kinase (ribokinase family)